MVWIDPGASLPLRIDITARVSDVEITGSLDDIRIDPPLDDALFRFEPPAGYTITKGQNAGMSDEEAITDLLRTYAANAEGASRHGSTTGLNTASDSPRVSPVKRSTSKPSGSSSRSPASRPSS